MLALMSAIDRLINKDMIMKGHLDNKLINRIAAGFASTDEIRLAEEHMRLCSTCREQVKVLSTAIHANKQTAVPGEHVRHAVLEEWHRINRTINVTKKRSLTFAWQIASGIAAVVIITAGVYLGTMRNLPGLDSYSIAVSSVSGDVYINKSPAVVNNSVNQGDVLQTGLNSIVSTATEGYRLIVAPSSELAVTGTGKNSGLAFHFVHGTVVSISEGFTGYSFGCGRYTVTPTGTEFMMQYENEKLEISVLHGGVMVTGEGVRMEIPSGMKWNSGEPGRLAQMNPELLKSIIDKIISGAGYEKTADDSISGNIRQNSISNHDETGKDVTEKNRAERNSEADELRRSGREMRDDIRSTRQEMKKERTGRSRD